MKTKKIQANDLSSKKYIEALLLKSGEDFKITDKDPDIVISNGIAKESSKTITYGLEGRPDLLATDINFNENGANLKIIYLGNVIPFWSKSAKNENDILGMLSAIAVGILINLNLVEISQIIKEI